MEVSLSDPDPASYAQRLSADPIDDETAWDMLLEAKRSGEAGPVLAAGDRHPFFAIFAPFISRGAEDGFAVAQFGQSLDGRIATPSGHSHYINGERAREHLHRIRALVDGVVVGVGTAVADDPELTVRHVNGPNPARIVLDPSGRLGNDARLLREDGARRILVQAEPRARREGIETIELVPEAGGFAPQDILAALAESGISTVLVEGGSHTVSRFLAHRALDRLHLLIAPMIIGSGPTGLCLPPIETLGDALRPQARVHALGEDILFDCLLERSDTRGRLQMTEQP